MLDKVIHDHLDRMDMLEDEMKDELEAFISQLNIDAVMDDPAGTMQALVDAMGELILENYAERAVKEGITFAKSIEGHRGKIEVALSDDPKLNEGELD